MKKKILAYIKVCGVIAVMAKFTSSFLSSCVLQRAGQLIFLFGVQLKLDWSEFPK